MATAATTTPWKTINDQATAHREQVLEQLRQWGVSLHRAGGSPPTRWLAAYDLAARPVRASLAESDVWATDRDHAEAAADDLWDLVAVAWGFLRWLAETRPAGAPPVERVVAELQLAGRWLAGYRVSSAAHDLAIDRLFSPEPEAAT